MAREVAASTQTAETGDFLGSVTERADEAPDPSRGRPARPLDRVVADLGATLLQVLAGDPHLAPDVRGIAIQGPEDHDAVSSGCVVLGVGLHEPGQIVSALRRLDACDASALIVPTPVDVDDILDRVVSRSKVALLGLAPGAQWQQLFSVLSTMLAASPGGALGAPTLGGLSAGDLFGLANAICALVGAPITIEDSNTNIIAFSDHQEDADFIRIECILGRRTPDLYAREDELRGAYRRIRHSEGPVFLEPMGLDDERETLPRVAMAIRAGDEILGSMWAVVRAPLTAERERLFIDASRLAALHMLQLRAGGDAEERLLTELVAAALEGGPDAASALAHLDLDRAPLLVLAMRTSPVEDGQPLDPLNLGQATAIRQRMAKALAVHLTSTWPGAVVATLRDCVYALAPAPKAAMAGNDLQRTCESFLQRTSELGVCHIGIGRIAQTVPEIIDSRADANRALRVLASEGRPSGVVQAVDTELSALLLELRDLVRVGSRRPSGAYARILDYDRTKRSFMVQTLRTWLEAGGDINAASAAAHVHQNTFRYRLKRLTEVGGFAIDDAEERFSLELQLRVYPPEDWSEARG